MCPRVCINRYRRFYKVCYIYLTTNIINDKKYIGQHRSDKYDKDYLGSGILLSKAVRKYGRKHSEEAKAKMRKAAKNRTYQIQTCPHCNKAGVSPVITRFHFDNCKDKK